MAQVSNQHHVDGFIWRAIIGDGLHPDVVTSRTNVASGLRFGWTTRNIKSRSVKIPRKTPSSTTATAPTRSLSHHTHGVHNTNPRLYERWRNARHSKQ